MLYWLLELRARGAAAETLRIEAGRIGTDGWIGWMCTRMAAYNVGGPTYLVTNAKSSGNISFRGRETHRSKARKRKRSELSTHPADVTHNNLGIKLSFFFFLNSRWCLFGIGGNTSDSRTTSGRKVTTSLHGSDRLSSWPNHLMIRRGLDKTGKSRTKLFSLSPIRLSLFLRGGSPFLFSTIQFLLLKLRVLFSKDTERDRYARGSCRYRLFKYIFRSFHPN
jgi:hypothetical protein